MYELSKAVGSVFQNPRSQFFNVDTTGEIAFGCENIGLPKEEIYRRIGQVTGELKIQKLLDRSLFALSGGEKQKIACASVSAMEPDIFVLDEPSSNLDVVTIADLKQVVAKWSAAHRHLSEQFWLSCKVWKVLAPVKYSGDGTKPDLHRRSPLWGCTVRIDAGFADCPAGTV